MYKFTSAALCVAAGHSAQLDENDAFYVYWTGNIRSQEKRIREGHTAMGKTKAHIM